MIQFDTLSKAIVGQRELGDIKVRELNGVWFETETEKLVCHDVPAALYVAVISVSPTPIASM